MGVIAGCSGDDAAPASTDVIESTESAGPASIAPDTEAPTTEPNVTPATITTAATTLPDTTMAPTSTVTTTPATTSTTTTAPVPADPTDAVRAAVDLVVAVSRTCQETSPACDTSLLSSAIAGEQLERAVAQAMERNVAGLESRNLDASTTRVDRINLSSDGRSALVELCIENAGILVQPGPPETVLDDTFVSSKRFWEMRLDNDSVWRLHDVLLAEEAIGEENSLCG